MFLIEKNKFFLDTPSRHKLLKDLPIVSVPVLSTGKFNNMDDILKYLGKSNYISSNHIENLRNESEKLNLDPERQIRETDNSNTMEGLYIKVEENGIVVDRMKYVRYSFWLIICWIPLFIFFVVVIIVIVLLVYSLV